MSRTVVHVAAIAISALAFAPGCSSMEKRWDQVIRRHGHEQTLAVDLNSAGRRRLAALPGLDVAAADQIIANRPYENRHDLVRKGVLNQNQFNKVRNEVYVDHGRN